MRIQIVPRNVQHYWQIAFNSRGYSTQAFVAIISYVEKKIQNKNQIKIYIFICMLYTPPWS